MFEKIVNNVILLNEIRTERVKTIGLFCTEIGNKIV